MTSPPMVVPPALWAALFMQVINQRAWFGKFCQLLALVERRGRRWRLNPIRPTVPEVLPLVRFFYALPDNGAGGQLLVVLDDYNIEDSMVQVCEKNARAAGDDAAEGLAWLLGQMSRTQRLRLCEER